MKKTNEKENTSVLRPPVVVVMGHIDHGKSTLLDYIRETNIVEKEAGGITQKISAYEVSHKDASGNEKRITFLDTPGHQSFSKMRERGAQIADIAILIVSAEDGVKPQTVEAWKTISENNIPCVVAINKIDKANADVEKTKTGLLEAEIYLEGYGGKIPFVEISAQTGQGVEDLLSLINIIAEMENISGNQSLPASGFILESNLDSQRGIQATLIIKNGTLKKGMVVAVADSIGGTNIMENFKGEIVAELSFSSPARLVGFSKMPPIGAKFQSFSNKNDAEKYTRNLQQPSRASEIKAIDKLGNATVTKKIIPIVLKADIAGSLEAIEKEIDKIKDENAEFKIIQKGVGPISESDIKAIKDANETLVIGFNVKTINKNVLELAYKKALTLSFFDVIYKMTEWLEKEMSERRPKIETVETLGSVKIIKIFSRTKERQVIGGRVLNGKMILNKTIKIQRRGFEIGSGKIINIEKNKTKIKEVEEGSECGMMIESKTEIAEGDTIESFNITRK